MLPLLQHLLQLRSHLLFARFTRPTTINAIQRDLDPVRLAQHMGLLDGHKVIMYPRVEERWIVRVDRELSEPVESD